MPVSSPSLTGSINLKKLIPLDAHNGLKLTTHTLILGTSLFSPPRSNARVTALPCPSSDFSGFAHIHYTNPAFSLNLSLKTLKTVLGQTLIVALIVWILARWTATTS